MTLSPTISRFIHLIAALAITFLIALQPAQAERIKDLGHFAGIRTNQLVGYGVVVGLAGTGDDSLEYATLGVKGMTSRFGLALPPGVNPATKNAAAVMVTAEMPAFAKPGQRMDVTVSALGKAKSLRGGTLIMMPLYGADQQIYAMAQGNLAVGGLGISAADGSSLTVNIPSVGRISGGATIERTVATGFESQPFLSFNLTDADITTSLRVADAINEAVGADLAIAADAVTVRIAAPPGAQERVILMGKIENLMVKPAEARARIIVNARTGTVVINGAVRLGPAAVSHGKLTVRVEENPTVVQPAPFSRGRTTTEPNSDIALEDDGAPAFEIGRHASLSEIVETINSIGVSPSDLTAILEGLKQAGALKAELIII
ncbi:flagellar basal body P-ring protein FlgI [Parasphingorhabdus sp.]|uniref:flagellar basal body P-ring protein FlgI n=1 Tax=Parasphingorhabdus sp. TaxID=2709688 RepID=UPI003BB02FF7